MPYVVSFTKSVEITDSEQYINDCCIGGDVVLEQLLPSLREQFEDIQSNQEDWGWFAWFDHAGVKLAVDVFTDDAKVGEFKIHLTSRRPRLLLGDMIEDSPPLENLRELVFSKLQSWDAAALRVEKVNEKYVPV